jgi:hypothetical protein
MENPCVGLDESGFGESSKWVALIQRRRDVIGEVSVNSGSLQAEKLKAPALV